MEKLSMCRICLAEDGLRLIVDTHLQEMYESLVVYPLETKDHRPIMVCYICCARLQNCFELRRSCLQSEELFTQMLNCDVQTTSDTLQDKAKKKRLTIAHPVLLLDLEDQLEMNFENVTMKQEKEDDRALGKESIGDSIQPAESEDGSVITIKMELEEESTSEHIPEKLRLATQKIPEEASSSNVKEIALAQIKDGNEDNIKTTNELTSSISVNNTEQYICDTCQECFSCYYSLERHIRLGSKVCKKNVLRGSILNKRTRKLTSKKKYQCSVCKKNFFAKSTFNMHFRTHTGEKPFECNICQKYFSTKSILKEHIRAHTGEKPHQCHICQKYFSRKSTLRVHIHTHSGEKPFQCTICQKNFSAKSSLKVHLHNHTGDKPYQCNVCPKKFSEKKCLKVHIRTHTGEKPYQCTICQQCFSNRRSLNIHTRNHTGEKPFQCNICQKYFSTKSNLKVHIRTHTVKKIS